jgi:adenylate kinase
LVFLGAPGVGKGTQAKIFCENRGCRHLSTGDLLREAVDNGTPLGLKAKEIITAGNLVPDSVILGLVRESLEAGGEAGTVFDGFPRTLRQAEDLDRVLDQREESLDRVILIQVDEDEIVRRLTARGRPDDTPETVRHRLSVYKENTSPLVDYYHERGILRRIDGMGAIPEIQKRVVAAAEGN